MRDAPVIRPDALVFGIGNSGRADDGLGWAFLEWLQAQEAFRGRCEFRYQLQAEDAALVAEAAQVLFVDAYRTTLPGGVRWETCDPAPDFQFTTHALPPRTVLSLCRDLYARTPPALLLMIEGTDWALKAGLSPAATAHLERARVESLAGLAAGVERSRLHSQRGCAVQGRHGGGPAGAG